MRIAILSTVVALTGCMTVERLPTASTYDVFDTACMSGTASFELQQAALRELTARGLTCREVAMQVLQNRMANPMPAPTPLTPYVMPTSRPQYQVQPSVTHGTLMGQHPTTSASGQAAYVCQYRTSTGSAQIIQLAANGPCAPTTNLR